MADPNAQAPNPAPGVDFTRIPQQDLDHLRAGEWDKVSQPVVDYIRGAQTPRPTMGENTGLAGPVGDAIERVAAPFEAVPALMTRAAESVISPVARLGARAVAAVRGKDDEQAANDASEWIHQGVYQPHTHSLFQPAGRQIAEAAQPITSRIPNVGGALEDAADKVVPGAGHAIEHGSSIANDVMGSLPVVGAAGDALRAGRAATTAADAEAARQPGYSGVVSRNGSSAAAAREAGYRGLRSAADLRAPGAQGVTDTLISHDAGLLEGQQPTVPNIQNARAVGPGRVYDQMEATLPRTMTATPALQQGIRQIVDGTSQLPRSPDIEALQQHMLNQPNMTSQQLFANIRGARAKASQLLASDNPDQVALGAAYSRLAGAYEDFAGSQIPINGVPRASWEAARVQFAKSYLAEASLKGGEHFNADVFGRAAKADPDLLTGGAKVVGDTYNALPAEATNGTATAVGAGLGAAGGAAVEHFVGGPVGAGPTAGAVVGGYAAPAIRDATRRLFTRGNTEAAAAAPTNPNLSYFYNNDRPAPAPNMELQPSPGSSTTPTTRRGSQLSLGDMAQPEEPFNEHITMEGNRVTNQPVRVRPSGLAIAGEGANPAPAAANGRLGDIAYSDMLSHGVEQSPPAGLTAGPMGAPPQQGLPFRVNAEHAAGDLSLGDQAAAPRENNSDLAAVQSSRIPDRTIGRDRELPRPSPTPGNGSLDLPPRPSSLGDELTLAPENSWFNGGAPNLGDHAAVMSQGVPEGTLQRTQPGGPGPTGGLGNDVLDMHAEQQAKADADAAARNPKGKRPPLRQGGNGATDPMDALAAQQAKADADRAELALGDEAVSNNGSGPGAEGAGSIEAGNRVVAEKANGNAPFELDADSNRVPIAHTVDAVDRPASPGNIKVQVDPTDGKLKAVDRGGHSVAVIRQRIAAYEARNGKGLGDEVTEP